MFKRVKGHFDLTKICTFIICVILFSGCTGEPNEIGDQSTDPNLVEINAVGLSFEVPDTIPSGWTTFRLNNATEMIHFALVQKMPEGRGLIDHQSQVAPVFQNIMNDINGQEPVEPEAGFAPPEWYSEVELMSGPGLVSAGGVAETTMYVEPGTYLVECYVKTDGIFHSYNPSSDVYGMVSEITVIADSTDSTAPEPTSKVTISSSEGYSVEGQFTTGENVIEVYFEDQNVYENFVGHDLHIAKLEDSTNMESLSEWMNWTSPNGMQTPTPANFVAGTNEMPAGSTSYIHVNFKPGNYMLIAEVPDPGSKGMLHRFTIE